MFQLIAASMFASNPLLSWVKKHFLTLLLVGIALAGITYVAYDFISTKNDNTQLKADLNLAKTDIAKRDVIINDQAEKIKTLNTQLELAKKSNDITNHTEDETHKEVIDSNNKHDERQKRLGHRITDVKKDPAKTDEQKTQEVSYAIAADLMVGWCGEHITSSPDVCKDYPDNSDTVLEQPASPEQPATDQPQPQPATDATPQGE